MRTVRLPRNTVQQASVAAKSAFERTMRLPVAHACALKTCDGTGNYGAALHGKRTLDTQMCNKKRI